jgi:transcriptional regulator with XRE-family HTH domain
VLKELREQKGWSQRDLAKRAKTTGAYIAMLETEVKTNPSAKVLRRLAKALGVPMDMLQADDELILMTKFKCERCEREIVIYRSSEPGQVVSAHQRAEILVRAQALHDEEAHRQHGGAPVATVRPPVTISPPATVRPPTTIRPPRT